MFNPDNFDLQCLVGDAARRQYVEHGPDNWVSVGKAALVALQQHLIKSSQDTASPGCLECGSSFNDMHYSWCPALSRMLEKDDFKDGIG